ncbi:hypothetical protein GCM10010261_22420 [Streptomyces pilosus]|uniref:Uncharacterized protein n=1 Tax=Streptomyces pilosus TaxID=28893 RepID=A0A918F1U1_9ACTN|nr:hypothetical protein GCM10010280_46460 [Streptomyces pilosus]GGV46850.1 hypothetical protein GCM10010261_22420 [Streptomyces pilosus]
MPILLFRGSRRGSGRPAAAIEQAGSPTVAPAAMRRAAAVAACEVYHVVAPGSRPSAVGAGVGCRPPGDAGADVGGCGAGVDVAAGGGGTGFGGTGREVGVRVAGGRAGGAGGSAVPVRAGGRDVVDRPGAFVAGDGSGDAGRAEAAGGPDFVGRAEGSGRGDPAGGRGFPGGAADGAEVAGVRDRWPADAPVAGGRGCGSPSPGAVPADGLWPGGTG